VVLLALSAPGEEGRKLRRAATVRRVGQRPGHRAGRPYFAAHTIRRATTPAFFTVMWLAGVAIALLAGVLAFRAA